jgi:hypothetical protein
MLSRLVLVATSIRLKSTISDVSFSVCKVGLGPAQAMLIHGNRGRAPFFPQSLYKTVITTFMYNNSASFRLHSKQEYEVGITIFFRENHTLRDEAASEAVLSTHTEERARSRNAFNMHLLRLKY